jgi:hypothetical protein
MDPSNHLIVVSICKEMGPLAALIYNRIFQIKILSSLNVAAGGPLNFLKPVLEYYETYHQKG